MHTTRYPLLMFVLINIDAGLNAVKTLLRCRPSGGLAHLMVFNTERTRTLATEHMGIEMPERM